MKRLKAFSLMVLLACAGLASGEIYKYVDDMGNVHFTDDFNQVPAAQRQRVQSFQEYEPEGTPQTASRGGDEPADRHDPAVSSASPAPDGTQAQALDDQLKALDQRKSALADEYEALMQENAQLNTAKKTVKTKADADKYNESVRRLNAKLKDHDRKRKEFFSDVEAYNARVGEANQSMRKSAPAGP
jgi:uncharacterized phage infection (PIP) family protein YhgE